MKQELENIVEIDLSTKETKQTKLNLSKEQLNLSATILANRLLDLVNSGISTQEITPKMIFGNKET